MGKVSVLVALFVITICIMGTESRCGPNARWYECKPCRSVPCGTTPPDVCTLDCKAPSGCYCEEGYREKNGECVLPCDC
ncbi:hypothetical protein JTB14_005456 [Gonioctena quinquepunctata]|nr:hypothetical protein JTB14_005456 [Gonioctena quinquepunctata]